MLSLIKCGVIGLSCSLTLAYSTSSIATVSKYTKLHHSVQSSAEKYFSKDICFVSPIKPRMNIFVSAGPSFARNDNSNTVRINNAVINNYDAQTRTIWNALVGIGANYTVQNIFNGCYDLSLGAAGYYVDMGDVKGIEHPFVNGGSFDTLNYTFDTKSFALMLESRLFYSATDWRPFALIGAGWAWNRLSGFNETPTNSALSAAPSQIQFGNQTNSHFAYELGVGLQHDLFHDDMHHILYTASLDYRYINFGSGKLGNTPAGDQLEVEHLSAQAIMLTLNAAGL